MPFLPDLHSTASLVIVRPLLAEDSGLLLGRDFFPWMVLAFGAAMVVGNVLALVRPPSDRPGADHPGADRPAVGRAVTMIVLGLGAALWGLASLLVR
jgi:hypothetical protein